MDRERESVVEGDESLLRAVMEGMRAGPGTVEWAEAVRAAGVRGGEVGGEVEALAAVRRRLEAGRRWREVSAGAGFTRKLMGRIEAEGKGSASWWGRLLGGWGVTGWVVALALAVVGGVLVWAVIGLRGATGQEAGGADVGRGAAMSGGGVAVGTPRAVWEMGQQWPAATSVSGGLRLGADGRGLFVEKQSIEGRAYEEGVARLERGWSAEELMVVEMEWERVAGSGGRPAVPSWGVELVVEEEGRGEERGNGAVGGAVKWRLMEGGGQAVVSGDGTQAGEGDLALGAGLGMTRVVFEGETARVEVEGRVVWEGAHGLGEGRRFVGVRFVGRGDVAGGNLIVRRVRVW